MAVMKQKYDLLKSDTAYAKLQETTEIIGIWDDHDYGQNDGGKHYSHKGQSKALLLDFLDVDSSDQVYSHEGIYQSKIIAHEGHNVKILLLDTRYFRDTLYTDTLSEERYQPNIQGDILGENQWNWLEAELSKNEADIHILISGYQVIAWEPKFEKWANFPKARKRLLDLIAKTKPNNLFMLSGDRHISEISALEIDGLDYPLYEFTSSGITHTWSEPWLENNQHRVTSLVIQKSFGLITINWEKTGSSVLLEMKGHNDVVFDAFTITF